MKRSKFNLSHRHLTTANMGKLIPFAVIPTLPGDKFKLQMKSFIRATPMLAPIMHDINFYTQWWYVPYRLLWDEWEDFITGGETGTSTPEFPTINLNEDNAGVGSLADYLGFRCVSSTETDGGLTSGSYDISAMPFRAYAEIWNTRYRDEDLQNEVGVAYGSGSDVLTNTDLLSPSWKKDYFTTARNSTQRGNEISVPILPVSNSSDTYSTFNVYLKFYISKTTSGNYNIVDSSSSYDEVWCLLLNPFGSVSNNVGNNSVVMCNSSNSLSLTTLPSVAADLSGVFSELISKVKTGITSYSVTMASLFSDLGSVNAIVSYTSDSRYYATLSLSSPVELVVYNLSTTSGTHSDSYPTSFDVFSSSFLSGNIIGAYVNLFNSTFYSNNSASVGALDIRTLRTASAMQRYQERSLKWGNRYEEFIHREFGVTPRDSRIDRPEYIGGSGSTLQIGEVFQTANDGNYGVGSYTGYGVGATQDRWMRYFSQEHGVIIGILSIRPAPVYMDGINREFLKNNRFDFFLPEFANVGMQEVYTGEIYMRDSSSNSDINRSVFGYQDRYQEYRYMAPRISGDFRKDGYLHWHLGRSFANVPSLNGSFINMGDSQETFDRVFAVESATTGWAQFMLMTQNNVIAYRCVPKRAKNILK